MFSLSVWQVGHPDADASAQKAEQAEKNAGKNGKTSSSRHMGRAWPGLAWPTSCLVGQNHINHKFAASNRMANKLICNSASQPARQPGSEVASQPFSQLGQATPATGCMQLGCNCNLQHESAEEAGSRQAQLRKFPG